MWGRLLYNTIPIPFVLYFAGRAPQITFCLCVRIRNRELVVKSTCSSLYVTGSSSEKRNGIQAPSPKEKTGSKKYIYINVSIPTPEKGFVSLSLPSPKTKLCN